MPKIIKTFDVTLDTFVNVPICDNWEELARQKFIERLQAKDFSFEPPEVYEEDLEDCDKKWLKEKVVETSKKIEEIIKREGGEIK
tara:strand:- start:813 stop:1067 length:255 start_codon:yes stop_codon:yes gene_type:complete